MSKRQAIRILIAGGVTTSIGIVTSLVSLFGVYEKVGGKQYVSDAAQRDISSYQMFAQLGTVLIGVGLAVGLVAIILLVLLDTKHRKR